MKIHKKSLSLLAFALIFSALLSSCDNLHSAKEENMKNIIVFGDSYSTFEGAIPEGYAAYYPQHDVNKLEETWWSLYAKKTNGKILLNDSWSGSTIGYTGYGNYDCSQSYSFIYRYRQHKAQGFFENNKIDTVLVLGGTNDSWSGAPLGEMMYSDWQESDLYKVLPAICHFVYNLKQDIPNAEIVLISNTCIDQRIKDCFAAAAEYYGVKCVQLHDIDMTESHPNEKGMKQICDQLIEALN